MTKMKKYPLFCFISLIFAPLLFSSCINITESDSGSNSTPVWGGYSNSGNSTEFVTLAGRISNNGAFPSQLTEKIPANVTASDSSRSAVSSVSPTGYFIQAKSGGETINGTVTDGSYSISLVLGKTYTVTAVLKSGETIILSDEWPDVTPTREKAGDGTLTHDFILAPNISPDAPNGFVGLSMTVDSSVKRVTTTCSDTAWGNTNENISAATYTLSKPKVDGDPTSGISPKTYEVTFNFYDDKGVLLYSSTQSVNVLPELTTDTWISGGGTAEPIDSTGSFNVTSDLISMFERTQIYVGNTGVKLADGSDVVPSDTAGTGSPYAPFATVSKALTMISAVGTSTTDYKIFISGEIKPKTGETTTKLPATLDEKVKSITICGVTGSETDILNGEQKGSVLTIETTKTVSIKNLTIRNGKATNGGGVNISAGTVKLEAGAKIAGNTASKNGGGVFITGTGTIVMSGGEISGNIANDSGGAVAFEKEHPEAKFTMTSGKISGNEASCAGGIYARNGIVSITGGEISGNNATGTSGGGIYCGGPVDTDPAKNGTVTVGGTAVIKGNLANKFGGGVFIEYGKTFAFEGGTIGENSADDANSAEQGGGIYVSGSLAMTGGVIKGNSVTEDGGGLYVSGTTELSGGTIESNSAQQRGGGVFMNNGTLTLSGSISIPVGSDKKNDLYLITGKTIELSDSLTSSNIATITPQEYADGTPILSLSETASTTIADEREKFSIKQQSEQIHIFDISNEGYLTNIVFSFDNTFPNGTVYGTETHKDENDEDKTYAVIKYRYTQYNNLSMAVTNPYQDIDWNMEFKLDGATTDPEAATTLSDGYHTLSATLTKGSDSVTAITRVRVRVKPVKVQISTQLHGWYGLDVKEGPCTEQTFYLTAGNPDDEYDEEKSFTHIFNNCASSSKDGKSAYNYYWNTPSDKNYVWLTDKSSNFYFYTGSAYDHYTKRYMGYIPKGASTTTRTLSALKSKNSFDSLDWDNNGEQISHYDHCRIWFSVSLDDSTDPPSP